MLETLARFLHRRRRAALAATVLFVIVAGMLGGPVFGLLDSSNDFDDPQAEAVLTRSELGRATGADATPDLIALVRLGASAASPAGQAKLGNVAGALRDPGIASVVRFRPGGDRVLVSKDGRSSYVLATFRSDANGALDRVKPRLERISGVTVGGSEVAQDQVGNQVSTDIARAELLAFPILFLLSLFVFRSLVAALLPLAVGATTILASFLVMRAVNAFEPMSIYALNLITGLGLGLAIDYSLFMVSRFREELEAGRDTPAALVATMRTAGRTVLFSSITVAAALASLLVFPLRFLYSMGVGGAACALAAALVSLTVLPAILAALGPRVNSLSPKRWQSAIHREASAERGGFWYRLSSALMRRPLPVAVCAAALLIALGSPFAGIRFTGVDANVLPPEQSARMVSDALGSKFPPNRTSPVFVAAQAPASGRAAVQAYAGRLGRLPNVVVAPQVQRAGDLWRIDLVGRGRPLDASAKDLVRAVRAVPAPFAVKVGGQSAEFVDQQASLASHLPIAVAILAVTTLVILFLMTGSVVLPIKALVMNALTLSGGVRAARPDLPGRSPRGAARLHEPGGARVLPARAALRGRLRALHRLRRVPAHAHQGGP